MILFLLVFLCSGFVPTATRRQGCASSRSTSPSRRRRHRARSLTGRAIGDHAIAASVGIAAMAYLWALRLYDRRRAMLREYTHPGSWTTQATVTSPISTMYSM